MMQNVITCLVLSLLAGATGLQAGEVYRYGE